MRWRRYKWLISECSNKRSKENDISITAAAGAYGAHHDILKDYDLVILAPQVASNYKVLKQDTDRLGIKLVSTAGKEYIELTRDPKKALTYVLNELGKDHGADQEVAAQKSETETVVQEIKQDFVTEEKNILVLCAGGGTSGLLANALTKGAKASNLSISAAAGAYGAHIDILKDYDLSDFSSTSCIKL